MKVSHELPLSLMHRSYEWNDYDYCLPHLIDKYEQYRLFFQKARLDKRFIIMDNGLFEGVTHTTEDLLDKINLIRPNVFIVPDAWNDSLATLRNAKEWINNRVLPEEVELMAVCQGNDIGELLTTYQTLVDLGYKYIALNHSSIAYKNFYPNHQPLNAQMYGRIELVRKLIETGIVRKEIHHHLLGSSDWKEFQAYTEFDWIKSVDTSAPIINGALGVRFDHSVPYIKPKEKLEDIMEEDLSRQIEDIIFNIEKFKSQLK